MFTGLVQGVVSVQSLHKRGAAARLVVTGPLGAVTEGESIALNGVCLTALRDDSDRFEVDLGAETVERTRLGELSSGEQLNFERALTLGASLGGHLVQGHVDECGSVLRAHSHGENLELQLGATPGFLRWCVPKGSVTIDGVSLTINVLDGESLSVLLIPHTLRETTLGGLGEGKRVHLEADMIGKHVVAAVERMLGAGEEEERDARLRSALLDFRGTNP